MKTKIAAAIALSLLAGSTFAAPTFYGEIDASIDYLPEDNASPVSDKDVVEVSSNSSFIGLKGDEKLTDRLSAVYGIEWGLSADGDSADWTTRNRFVGLKDAQLGTLKVGAHDTPLKQLSSVVDTFNNYVANKADVTGIFTGENRISNAVIYESPAIKLPAGAIKVNALLASGEDSAIAKGNGSAKTAGRGLGDAWSASVAYESPVVVAGIAYDKAIPSNFAGRGFTNAATPEVTGTVAGSAFAAANTLRAIGRVNIDGGLALKALYQTSEVEAANGNEALAANIDESQGWLVGAEYNLPNAKAWTVKAQYSQNTTSFKNTKADFDAKQYFAGVDYAFNKQVKAYGYAGYLTLEQASNETKQPVVGTGLEYKF
ncbi:porin [Acinetobacter bouvetii]|uniref:Major outer membrane protein P.IA n=1 Tax=Acinetobacter bouvetii TaxID=202951 RepID=A0A811GMQ4_9GAMM|nr:porin [Acinetobacter bouvetii]CAB1222832.1 Major outer membrane protein P.IA [Acinetobacter bouvetii]